MTTTPNEDEIRAVIYGLTASFEQYQRCHEATIHKLRSMLPQREPRKPLTKKEAKALMDKVLKEKF